MNNEKGSRKIVIAGGTGMIGRHLSNYLVDRGYRIIILTRRRNDRNSSGIRYVQWNAESAGSWCEELEDAFAVINLCGESIAGARWTDKRKHEILRSRIAPLHALVAAINAARTPPKAFLQASGVGYYGTGDDERTEKSPVGQDFLAELAAKWEEPLSDLPIRHVAMRLGVVLDASDGALPQILRPFRFFAGGRIASGHQWFSWVHIHDVLRAVDFMLTNDSLSGPVNIVAPGCVRNDEFTQIVGNVLSRPALFAIPYWIMSIMLGEQAILVTEGQCVNPKRLSTLGFRFAFSDIESALRDLLQK